HLWLSPWQLFSSAPEVDVHDVDDELAIPVDLLGEDEAVVSEPPPEEQREAPPPDDDPDAPGAKKPDAGPTRTRDAGAPDAAALGDDAGVAAADLDGGLEGVEDAGAVAAFEGLDGGDEDAGLLAEADASAGPGASGPRD